MDPTNIPVLNVRTKVHKFSGLAGPNGMMWNAIRWINPTQDRMNDKHQFHEGGEAVNHGAG